ncbi:WSC domain-containing protein [Cladochytrium replicatum]|nr:WSC domain-containing protein [Cladochytrium replicatum]
MLFLVSILLILASFLPFSSAQSTPIWINGVVDGFTYTGCYVDNPGYRALETIASFPQMTPTLCRQACSSLGYSFAGLEAGSNCWCGRSLRLIAKRNDSECSSPCSGNRGEKCGGTNRISLFGKQGIRPPTLKKRFSLLGCFDFDTIPSGEVTLLSTMTIDVCAARCSESPGNAAGIANGNTCWCGTLPDGIAEKNVPTVQCNKPCGGDRRQICGGSASPNMLLLFRAPVQSPRPSPPAVSPPQRPSPRVMPPASPRPALASIASVPASPALPTGVPIARRKRN